jgi:hypothetical protein
MGVNILEMLQPNSPLSYALKLGSRANLPIDKLSSEDIINIGMIFGYELTDEQVNAGLAFLTADAKTSDTVASYALRLQQEGKLASLFGRRPGTLGTLVRCPACQNPFTLSVGNTDEETGTCVCTHCDSMSLIADLIPKEG